MHERSEADAFFYVAQTVSLRTQADSLRYIFSREPFALGMIVSQLKRAIQQAFQINFLANDLIRRGRLAFFEEIATTKFFRS